MKKLLFALLHATRVTTLVAWYNRERVTFLCYHGVTKRPTRSPADPKGLHVNQFRFAAQLDFLRRRYQVISLSDYLRARSAGSQLPRYSAVLTFDDGFRNFLTAAAPLLAARRMPATVFLITDKAGERTNFPIERNWTPKDDETHLSWAEARLLKSEQGIEFGSHTCSHPGLLSLSPADTERELAHSRKDLLTQLGVQATALSYPKGQYSSMLANQARKLGYACAVTTDRGPNELDDDLFTLGRTLIGDNDDVPSFAVRASGLRWWLASMRNWISPRLGPESKKTDMPVSSSAPWPID